MMRLNQWNRLTVFHVFSIVSFAKGGIFCLAGDCFFKPVHWWRLHLSSAEGRPALGLHDTLCIMEPLYPECSKKSCKAHQGTIALCIYTQTCIYIYKYIIIYIYKSAFISTTISYYSNISIKNKPVYPPQIRIIKTFVFSCLSSEPGLSVATNVALGGFLLCAYDDVWAHMGGCGPFPACSREFWAFYTHKSNNHGILITI